MAGLSEYPEVMAVRQLTEWFVGQAKLEATLTAPKAIDYGSIDTINIGKSLISIFGGVAEEDIDKSTAFEAGVFFFIKGKMARWEAALRRGEKVSDDTLFDLGIYVKMVQRARDCGAWPLPDSFSRVTPLDGVKMGNTPVGGGVNYSDVIKKDVPDVGYVTAVVPRPDKPTNPDYTGKGDLHG